MTEDLDGLRIPSEFLDEKLPTQSFPSSRRDWGDYYHGRAENERELAEEGTFTPHFMGSILRRPGQSEQAATQMIQAACVEERRKWTGTMDLVAAIGEQISVGTIGYFNNWRYFTIIGASGDRLLFDPLATGSQQYKGLRLARSPGAVSD